MSYISEDDEVIDRLAREVGRTEDGKGFRDDWKLSFRLDDLALDLLRPEEEVELLKKAAKALRSNILGTKMMLIVSEIAEALDSLRETGPDALNDGNVDEEYADAVIRILANADMVGISVGQALIAKARKNKERPVMHGKQL